MKLIELIRDILSRHGKEADPLSQEQIREMTLLIENAVDNSQQSNPSPTEQVPVDSQSNEPQLSPEERASVEKTEESEEDSKKPGFDFSTKREWSTSLKTIREFIETFNVDEVALREILETLLEIAMNVGKRTVTMEMLSTVYNGLHFEEGRAAAFKEGEIAGRNAKIEEKFFPANDDGLPHLHGSARKRSGHERDIFSMARNACV